MKTTKNISPTTITVKMPESHNAGHGFYGTMTSNKKRAWAAAVNEFYKETGCVPEAIRVWLDATAGRHFADQVNDQVITFRRGNLNISIEETVAYCVRQYFNRARRNPSYSKSTFIRQAMEWYADDLAYDVSEFSEEV